MLENVIDDRKETRDAYNDRLVNTLASLQENIHRLGTCFAQIGRLCTDMERQLEEIANDYQFVRYSTDDLLEAKDAVNES